MKYDGKLHVIDIVISLKKLFNCIIYIFFFWRLFEFDVDNEKCQGEFYFSFECVWVCELLVLFLCACWCLVVCVCSAVCACLSEFVRFRRVAAILAIYTIVSPYSFFVFYYTRLMTIINSSQYYFIFFYCKTEVKKFVCLNIWC